MGLKNAQTYTWMPQGLSDNRETKTGQIGDCRVLRNLILDPTSKGVLAPRGASVPITIFESFTTPGIVSVVTTIGTRVYGLIASGRNAGYDEPFCYDTATSAFVTVSGITSANVPTTPSTTGDWTPPSTAQVGVFIAVTHPGFTGANFFGWFDLTNPAAPAWSAGNTTGAIVLSAHPTAVGTYYNRAWYAVGSLLVFTDSLSVKTVTNAGQALQIGSSTPITAIIPQPFTTGTQGILGALLAIKSSSIWQITGDYSLTNLALNELTGSVGTVAPNSVQSTPLGTMFLAVDGIRTVQLAGNVSEPQPDVVTPFYNVLNPSRACAAYAADVYRISLNTVSTANVLGYGDYWYALKYSKWSGPHDFQVNAIAPLGNGFVLASNSIPATLFLSKPYPSSSDSYTENGAPMTITMTTVPIEPNPPMSEKASIEMSIFSLPSSVPYTVQVVSANNVPIGSSVIPQGKSASLWGAMTWGAFTWGAAPYNLAIENLSFPVPLVFRIATVTITGASASNLRLGHFSFKYEALGYLGG